MDLLKLIVIIAFYTTNTLNKLYTFFSPSPFPIGAKLTKLYVLKETYEVLDYQFGKNEILNLDTGEVKWYSYKDICDNYFHNDFMVYTY